MLESENCDQIYLYFKNKKPGQICPPPNTIWVKVIFKIYLRDPLKISFLFSIWRTGRFFYQIFKISTQEFQVAEVKSMVSLFTITLSNSMADILLFNIGVWDHLLANRTFVLKLKIENNHLSIEHTGWLRSKRKSLL